MIYPEHASISAFVEHCLEDDRVTFSHEDMTSLYEATKIPPSSIRIQLEGWGLRLELRESVRRVRGFLSNPNDRFSACPMHGGAQFGNMMTQKYGSLDTFTPAEDKRPQKRAYARR